MLLAQLLVDFVDKSIADNCVVVELAPVDVVFVVVAVLHIVIRCKYDRRHRTHRIVS